MATVEAPPAEELAFGELSIPREYVLARDGREYILSEGLLHGLVQLSRGFYDLATDIVQLPTAENAKTAICTAKVTVFDPETGHVLRTATGIGDASPDNVGRMVAPHVLRMAETRAVARALRHLLGVGLTALEELGQGGAEGAADAPAPAAGQNAPVRPSWGTPAAPHAAPVAAAEHILIQGKAYERPQVVAGYKKVLTEAREAGLTIAPADLVPEDAPLALLAGAAQSVRRRLEVRSTGK